MLKSNVARPFLLLKRLVTGDLEKAETQRRGHWRRVWQVPGKKVWVTDHTMTYEEGQGDLFAPGRLGAAGREAAKHPGQMGLFGGHGPAHQPPRRKPLFLYKKTTAPKRQPTAGEQAQRGLFDSPLFAYAKGKEPQGKQAQDDQSYLETAKQKQAAQMAGKPTEAPAPEPQSRREPKIKFGEQGGLFDRPSEKQQPEKQQPEKQQPKKEDVQPTAPSMPSLKATLPQSQKQKEENVAIDARVKALKEQQAQKESAQWRQQAEAAAAKREQPQVVLTDEIRAHHQAPYKGAFVDTSWGQEQQGFPKALETLRSWSDEDLHKERTQALKDSFGQIFGRNAKKYLNLVDQVIAERKAIQSEGKQRTEAAAAEQAKPQQAAAHEEPLTDEDKKALQAAYATPTPGILERYATMTEEEHGLAAQGYAHTYHSLEKPLAEGTIPGAKLSGDKQWLYTKEPLSLKQIATHGLVGGSAEEKGRIALALHTHEHGDKPFVLMSHDNYQRGVVVARSAKKPGQWQVTHFDKKGFAYDETYKTQEEAVAEATRTGYRHMAPHELEELAATEEFARGNALTMRAAQMGSRTLAAQAMKAETPARLSRCMRISGAWNGRARANWPRSRRVYMACPLRLCRAHKETS